MKPYLFKALITLLVFTSTAAVQAQTPAKVSLRLKSYTVRAENDGLDANPSHKGDGIELYVGYIVSGQDKRVGGTTEVADGLSTEKDKKTPKTFPRTDALCTNVDVPEGASVAVRVHLIESDETTDKVKAAFADSKVPNFAEGARNFSPEVLLNLFKNFGDTVKELLKGENTDDDYGYWTFALTNAGGKITVAFHDRGPNSHEAVADPNIPVDGKFHDLFTGTFKDKENDIDVAIELSASH